MDIDKKSVGTLIDELITTNIKLWFTIEELCNTKDEKIAAKNGKLSHSLNARRNALIRAIDTRLGEGDITPTEKTYK